MKVVVDTIAPPDWGLDFSGAAHGSLPLRAAGLPRRVRVPLLQHTGRNAVPLITVGDRVSTGQPIGAIPEHSLGARVHAPVSGQVTDIAPGPLSGRNRSVPCITIESDGQDERWAGYHGHERPLSLATPALRRAIIEAGIVGLGGATFPAGVKLNRGSGVGTLILNGVECEPHINCDDALLRTDPASVLAGAQIMLRILEAGECIVALKQSGAAALTAMREAIAALDDDRFRIALLPDIYPTGGEAQLIQLLTGQELPAGGLPWDSGAICQNVGTAAAVARFLATGEPLISRIVTVTGGGVTEPVNLLARIGTPVADLIDAAGGYAGEPAALIMGGPMMGVPLADDSLPLTKAMNCLYVPSADELTPAAAEQPCIRCGDCATVCPANLMPQLLLEAGRTQDFGRLRELGLPDCIECGCCDYVCPSHIPMTGQFADGKQRLYEIAFEKRRGERAVRRFAARNERLDGQGDAAAGQASLHDVSNAAAARDELSALLARAGATGTPQQRSKNDPENET